MRKTLRRLLLIGFVYLSLLSGCPMRPEEIEELLAQSSRPKLAHVLKDESDTGKPDQK